MSPGFFFYVSQTVILLSLAFLICFMLSLLVSRTWWNRRNFLEKAPFSRVWESLSLGACLNWLDRIQWWGASYWMMYSLRYLRNRGESSEWLQHDDNTFPFTFVLVLQRNQNFSTTKNRPFRPCTIIFNRLELYRLISLSSLLAN